jgi:hypothetical protein
MSDPIDTLDVLPALDSRDDVDITELSQETIGRLRVQARSLAAIGYRLILVVPTEDDIQRLGAYALPGNTESLRDALAKAEQEDA